jgi:hypothetical protein
MGVFKQNNQFWKARATHGRGKIFEDPEQLWQAACEYFEWIDANPLQTEKILPKGNKVDEELMRPYTISGMCLFIEVSEDTFRNYCTRMEFKEVCAKIEAVIWNQKFAGAAANLLNANVISRELGLIYRQGLELSKAPPQNYSALTDEELKTLIYLEQKLSNGTRNIEPVPRELPAQGV